MCNPLIDRSMEKDKKNSSAVEDDINQVSQKNLENEEKPQAYGEMIEEVPLNG